MPTMTQVRSILPDRLKRARFTTIAKDPSYRRYFAAGDDSASIRTTLTDLYEAGGNATRLWDFFFSGKSFFLTVATTAPTHRQTRTLYEK